MPCNKYFRASFVLGRKAVEAALASTLSGEVKEIVNNAIVYAEGSGVRIAVSSLSVVSDVKKLIDIKLSSGAVIP